MTWVTSSDCITNCCQNWSFQKLWRFEYYEEFKILFFLCSVEFCFSAFFFFFVPVFILCLFRGDELHNYFTSIIGLYNGLLSKIGFFKSSGKLGITNSLKLDFSVCFKVLLFAFFFVPVFISFSFYFVCSFWSY